MFKELLEDFEKLSLELTGDQMEVYASNVLDDLEKIALAKWKRNFHTLSPENQELLTKSTKTGKMGWKEIESHMKKINEASKISPVSKADRRRIHEANIARKTLDSNFKILDHEKELAGLNTGSYAMAKKFGVPMGHFDEKYLIDKIKKYFRTAGPNALGREFPTLFNETLDRRAKDTGKYMFKEDYSSLYHPTSKDARVIHLGNRDLTGKPRSLAQRYYDAIATRHEVDEIRSQVRLAKNVRKNYFSDDYTHLPLVRGRFFTHAHPDVIARESAHVAIAPKEVRDSFIQGRSRQRIPGVEYGKNAVPELKKSRKYREQWLKKWNREFFDFLPYPMTRADMRRYQSRVYLPPNET